MALMVAIRGVTAAFIGLLLLRPEICQAQSRHPKRLMFLSGTFDTSPRKGADGGDNDTPAVSLDVANGVGSLLNSGTSRSQLFDAYYMDGVRRLQMASTITNNPNDFNERQSSRAAQRALTAKAVQTLQETINNSELRDAYKSMIRGFQAARDTVRFSVQRDSQGVTVGKHQKGERLVEFSVEPSDRTLIAPNVNFADKGRLRYDANRNAIMFELRRDW